jgi:subtilisin family serine protease
MQMKRLISLLFLGVLVYNAPLPAASKLASDLNQELATSNPSSNIRVIVQWKSGATTVGGQKILSLGGLINAVFSTLNAALYTLPVSAVLNLQNDPDVVYITPDRVLQGKLDNSTAAVNAPAAWNAGYNGAGVGVAVLDSGINANPNLKRIAFSFDFTQPNLLAQ